MNGNGDDWSVALAVIAVVIGSAGILGDHAPLTVAAWILLAAAIVAIVADRTTPELALASCATGVVIVGTAATFTGYLINSEPIAYGGLTIAVVASVVAIVEMWEAT